MSDLQKLLYLGFAFPPGVAGHFLEAQPAGHWIETNLVNSLRPWFEIRSVGISWIRVDQAPPGDSSPGLPHALNLLDKRPELVHRLVSLARLKHQYRCWIKSGWIPNVLLVCNFSPVFNGFIRWLSKSAERPYTILYLADSMHLQQEASRWRSLRRRAKPLTWPDSEMVRYVNACVAVSASTKQFFTAQGLPWLWLPNGTEPARAVPANTRSAAGPIRFGYFGTLARHGGASELLKVFTSSPRDAELHICGFGKNKALFLETSRRHPGLIWHEPRTPDQCLQLAATWDVLINPRPNCPGNENNFSSKVFEYGLSGRAILTSRVSGVERILGDQAFYFDENDFEASLDQALSRLATVPREELNRRGMSIQQRLVNNFSWLQQGRRLAGFIHAQLDARNPQANTEVDSVTGAKLTPVPQESSRPG
jgi:glycosyltransferase involved in cell wall biosynthesis